MKETKTVRTNSLSKQFFIAISIGLLGIFLFVLAYSPCSWGGCSSNEKLFVLVLLFISGVLLLTCAVYLLGWVVNVFRSIIRRAKS